MSVQQKNFKAIADAIREKTGETELLKPSEFADKIDNVYTAGQSSMVDESKLIPKTVSGSYISVDDVSEIPHSVGCKISGGDNPETVKVTRCGANLLNPNNLGSGELVEYNGVLCYKYIDHSITNNKDVFMIQNCFKPNTQYTLVYKQYRRPNAAYPNCSLNAKYTDGTSTSTGPKTTGELHSFTTDANKTVSYIAASYYAGETMYLDLSVSGLYEGTTALPYEPYNEQTITPNADGTVEGMTSVSPYMNIFSDTEGVNIEATYNKSYGMQTEYDRFWDIVQSNGTRRSYVYGFAGPTWKKENFKPKYDLLVTNGNLMFVYSAINVDLVEYLESIGIRLDFTGNAGGNSTFQQTDFTRVGVVDFSKASPALSSSFANSELLETIDELILSDKGNQTFTSTFSGTSALKNIKITGVIGNDISFRPCPLSKASIISIINALSDSVTGKTLTLNLSAVNTAFETSEGAADGSTSEEFAALVATKTNWTITMI